MTREKLIEISKQYFEGSKLNVVYATSDNNFFYDRNQAMNHSKAQKVEWHELKRNEIFAKPEKTEIKKVVKKTTPKKK